MPGNAKRFALIIGVDQYDDTQINKLEGSSNDAKALADALIRYGGFPTDQVIVLASDQAAERRPTRGNILRRLSNLRSSVPKDGLLLVSFAGHGIERDGRAYLLPTDAQVSRDLALLEETAINAELVRNWIRQSGVGQVLIIMDACRNNPSSIRGNTENAMTEAYAHGFNFDMRNREVLAFATLYATEVGQVAYEYKERKQGYFTWALVEGLKGGAANEKGEVTLAGLVSYLQQLVPKRVLFDLGEGKIQRPFAVIEGYKAEELVLTIAISPDAVAGNEKKASPTAKTDADEYRIKGDRLALEGKWHEAGLEYGRAIKLDTNNALLYYSLGLAQFMQQKRAIAEIPLRKAVELEPNNAQYRVRLGQVLAQQHYTKHAEAEALFREAVRLNPKEPWWHIYLGDLLIRSLDPKKLAEAEKEFREAVGLDHKNEIFRRRLEYVVVLQSDMKKKSKNK